ncbi:MAG: D-alanyl-D-alanine carboxypeptidase [Ruminococcus sp.]|nr:D-alanyl-D-alanine carboxypeptidase [Ruminococcus sp.]
MLITLLPSFEVYGAGKPSVSALAAVLISADTGEIIYSVNHEAKLPMASTTKIMTALLCLESGNLDEEFVVDSEAIKVEGSSMGLQEGDIVTKYALCCGMLLPSGNDAANAAAVRIAGSIEAFAEMMNERAEEIGLTKTYFVTPSGLDGEGHGSSAYDMALLAREALKNETFREICSSETIKLSFGNPPYDRWLTNTNKLLSMDDGVYGVKTGFTDEAGRCLVSACERDGENLICVTLNDKNDWNDHIAMYEYGFQTVQNKSPELPETFELDIVGAQQDKITLEPDMSAAQIATAADDFSQFSYEVIAPPFVYAPIKTGEQAAALRIAYQGREVCIVPLLAAGDYDVIQDTSKNSGGKKNFFEKIIAWFRD